MGHFISPFGSTNKAINALDRKRERERKQMLQAMYKNSDELATLLVQKLLDKNIIETDSVDDIRGLFSELMKKMSSMEDFDIQYKIAPLRQLTQNPNFISLYLTQYIVEDLINNDKINDIYGDDLDIYQAVNLVMNKIQPPS
jgi:hypothetical protein